MKKTLFLLILVLMLVGCSLSVKQKLTSPITIPPSSQIKNIFLSCEIQRHPSKELSVSESIEAKIKKYEEEKAQLSANSDGLKGSTDWKRIHYLNAVISKLDIIKEREKTAQEFVNKLKEQLRQERYQLVDNKNDADLSIEMIIKPYQQRVMFGFPPMASIGNIQSQKVKVVLEWNGQKQDDYFIGTQEYDSGFQASPYRETRTDVMARSIIRMLK